MLPNLWWYSINSYYLAILQLCGSHNGLCDGCRMIQFCINTWFGNAENFLFGYDLAWVEEGSSFSATG